MKPATLNGATATQPPVNGIGPYPSGFRVGRRARLDPIEPHEYDLIARMEALPPTDILYRNMAMTPSPGAFVESLWHGVSVQFAIRPAAGGDLVGLVACYNSDFRHGHATIAAHIFDDFRGRGWPIEGVVLFVNYLFFGFSYRKLYADVIDLNLPTLRGEAGRLVREEGRLVDHYFVAGEHRDRVTLAIHRTDWVRSRYWIAATAAQR